LNLVFVAGKSKCGLFQLVNIPNRRDPPKSSDDQARSVSTPGLAADLCECSEEQASEISER